jgi:ABC-type uncharacterized transport system ATPase subunit
MRVNGAWLSSEDGETRPIVPGLVRLTNNQWLEVSFLLDAGADRIVFSARFLQHLQDLESNSPQILLSGVGGGAESITVETAIAFARDDGQLVTVLGTYGVFTKGESADISMLGRDVTNNFSVIYDYPEQIIALLAPPHSYEMKSPS